ncbi:hypothetical protein [Aliamphritea spongicola]|nr:hypothetical protein [Aliamphritea spongicola]
MLNGMKVMSFQNDQTQVFLEKEADAWFERNFSKEVKQNRDQDLVLKYLRTAFLDGKKLVK